MLVYHYKQSGSAENYLELKFCVTGNTYCDKKSVICDACQLNSISGCTNKVSTLDLLSFRFSAVHLAQFARANTAGGALTDKILNFRHPSSFTKILSIKANHKIVSDSQEVMKFWATTPKLKAKSDFVWNSLDVNEKPETSTEERIRIRKDFYKAESDKIVIGLVGRINRWKGQKLLLEAFNILLKSNTNIKLVFLGSPPENQEIFLTELEDKIKAFGLENDVEIIPFQKEIWKFWDSVDIAVVPSTEPEPFGMVAIEAMLCKKPVVASNHGGLTEIVLHNQTGFLFEPNNENQLAEYLQKLIDSSDLRGDFGQKGHQRVLEHFSIDKHVQKFEQIFEEILR